MTNFKKIVISAIASGALFGSMANAGALAYSIDGNVTSTGTITTNQLTLAEELFSGGQNADISILGNTADSDLDVPKYRYDNVELLYGATIGGSGSVSDAVINLDFNGVSEDQFKTAFNGKTFVLYYIGENTNAANDGIAVDANTNNSQNVQYEIIAIADAETAIQNIGTSGTRLTFDSDSTVTITDNKVYRILITDQQLDEAAIGDPVTDYVTNGVGTLSLDASEAQFKDLEATLSVWSASGTEELRDTAKFKLFTVAPQYKVACEQKLDALINTENQYTTFVPTKHDELVNTATINNVTGEVGDIMDVRTDKLRFSVQKFAVDIGLDGNQSVVEIFPSNTAIVDHVANGNLVLAQERDNTATGPLFVDANATVTTTPSSIRVFSANTTGAYTGLDAFGPMTYNFDFVYDGNTTIPESTFTASYYVNEDLNYWPAASLGYTHSQPAGEWMNYTYIAQIAGAETGGAAGMKTKFYITNRSCKAVQPKFRIIKDGEVTEVTMPQSIAVDSQAIITLAEVYAEAGIPVPTDVSSKCSVEIILPGIAEQFYIYAQNKNSDLGQFKDLPVYNTSDRD